MNETFHFVCRYKRHALFTLAVLRRMSHASGQITNLLYSWCSRVRLSRVAHPAGHDLPSFLPLCISVTLDAFGRITNLHVSPFNGSLHNLKSAMGYHPSEGPTFVVDAASGQPWRWLRENRYFSPWHGMRNTHQARWSDAISCVIGYDSAQAHTWGVMRHRVYDICYMAQSMFTAQATASKLYGVHPVKSGRKILALALP